MSSVLTLNGGVLVTSNGAPLTGDATTINGYFTVTDTTDAAGGTIRTISLTEGTPVIQNSKSVTINSNTTTTITPDSGNTAMGQVVVTTNVSGGSVTPADEKDVNFIDYDGTILYSYTKTEFANLSAMPANPTHTGLTAQGWNWTKQEISTQLTAMPDDPVLVGQMYTTSDGKTRIYIRLEKSRLSPYLGIAVNGTATVNWGDGSNNSTVTGTSTSTVINTQHNYAAAGDYVIAISVSGSMALVGHSTYGSQVLWKNSTTANQNCVYQNAIQKVEIGANTSIGAYVFRNCYSLASITIPSGVTSIDTQSFYGCHNLTTITIPSEVTNIENEAFRSCYNLVNITIPSGVTSIGGSAFYYCYGLPSITIPSGVTSIGNNVFNFCRSLISITIPSEVTSIGIQEFESCYSLANVTILSGVTSIGNYAFNSCYSFAGVTIPSGVTSIGTYAFYFCYGLGEIHFKPTNPPTVSASNAFGSLPTDCIIYVPYSANHSVLAAYTSATNYPSSSTYTYIEET